MDTTGQSATKHCDNFGRCNCIVDCQQEEELTLWYFKMDGDHATSLAPYRKQAIQELIKRKNNGK